MCVPANLTVARTEDLREPLPRHAPQVAGTGDSRAQRRLCCVSSQFETSLRPCQPPAMPQADSLHVPLMPVFSRRAHAVLKGKTEASCPEEYYLVVTLLHRGPVAPVDFSTVVWLQTVLAWQTQQLLRPRVPLVRCHPSFLPSLMPLTLL